MGNFCYLMFRNTTYCFLSKNLGTETPRPEILTVVLHGCESCSHSPLSFQGAVNSDSFREKSAKENIWPKLKKLTLKIIAYWGSSDWACGTHGKKIYCYRVLIRKREGKRILGRPRLRWQGIEVDIIILLILNNWELLTNNAYCKCTYLF